MPTKRVPQWPCDAKIYKIWWRDCTDVYVGSTRRLLLCDRMKGHRSKAKQGNTPVHAAIRRNGPFEYDLLETVSCQNFDEARTHERRWADILDANLNQRRPICTKEERKEYFMARQAEYYSHPENKIKMAEYRARPETKIKRTGYNAKYHAKNICEKRFTCEACQYFAATKSKLTLHKKTKKHIKNTQTHLSPNAASSQSDRA